MPVITFAAPLLPGKTEAWKQAATEMAGSRSAEFDESRKRMGVTREVVSLQETPAGDFVCVFIEGDDPNSLIARYLSSDHPFDRWFAETVLIGAHGIGPSSEGLPPNQVFVDWSA